MTKKKIPTIRTEMDELTSLLKSDAWLATRALDPNDTRRPEKLPDNFFEVMEKIEPISKVANIKAKEISALLLESKYDLWKLNQYLAENQIDAFTLVRLDEIQKARKFSPRQRDLISPIRTSIRRLLKKNPAIKNNDLWEKISSKPPKGWCAYDSPSLGKYFECEDKLEKSMNYKTFANTVSKERRLLK